MENEIKVGEWVRTDNGIIGEYVKYRGIEDAIETNNKWIGFDIENDIVKHSPNIIDLIEVGDYVNGILVTGKESTLLWTEIKGIDRSGYHIPISQYGANIKSIVTKEQFESISYKVKE